MLPANRKELAQSKYVPERAITALYIMNRGAVPFLLGSTPGAVPVAGLVVALLSIYG